ncbi:MAG: hypothetical protein BroJett017_27870 [Ignavibacteriota bacterium]|nr:MAG: hypothetical protein BroJett017_27870 [Ignavibacteriota bacterium]
MSEEELKDLLDKNKNLKLIKLNDTVLKKVKSAVQDYIIRIREYGMAEVFTPDKFSEIEHLLECNYLMNVINMNTDYGISRIVRFQDSMFYYAELVSSQAMVIAFMKQEGMDAINIDIHKISDALDVLTFPYKYLNLLSKKDRLAADRLLRKYSGNQNAKQALPIHTRNPKADYIKNLKRVINELRNTPPYKVDKSKVAKKLGVNYSVNTLNDNLFKNKIKYHRKTKQFEDLETGEIF